MEILLLLLILGLFTGMLGTMIGAGGGFILVPLLLIIFPDKTPEQITSMSLAVVFFNAVSGTLAYRKMKRIDYRSGLLFAAFTIPGSILGSLTVRYLTRDTFSITFGLLLIILSIYLILRPESDKKKHLLNQKGLINRHFKDSDNIEYNYSYNKYLGMATSLLVGFVSSLLGIGGGIVHVPIMVNLLDFPTHIATATSHFVISIIAFSGSTVHFLEGTLSSSLLQVLFLSTGAVIGAQAGARLSKMLKGRLIIRLLALSLALVGIRLLLSTFL